MEASEVKEKAQEEKAKDESHQKPGGWRGSYSMCGWLKARETPVFQVKIWDSPCVIYFLTTTTPNIMRNSSVEDSLQHTE